jgi:hypothetical protein
MVTSKVMTAPVASSVVRALMAMFCVGSAAAAFIVMYECTAIAVAPLPPPPVSVTAGSDV